METYPYVAFIIKRYVSRSGGVLCADLMPVKVAVKVPHAAVVYSLDIDSNGVIWACVDDGTAILVSDCSVIGSFESEGLLESPLYCVGSSNDGTILQRWRALR
mgnify:CR=1 FL=1